MTGVDETEREALGALIGRKGERLSALQHLVNLMLSRRMGAWTRVLVDVEDYRGRRERQLAEIAKRAAERVIESGTMLQLEPMPALERRWIHLALRDVPGVATQSIGTSPCGAWWCCEPRTDLARAGGPRVFAMSLQCAAPLRGRRCPALSDMLVRETRHVRVPMTVWPRSQRGA